MMAMNRRFICISSLLSLNIIFVEIRLANDPQALQLKRKHCITFNTMGCTKWAAQNEQVDDQHLDLDNHDFSVYQNVYY